MRKTLVITLWVLFFSVLGVISYAFHAIAEGKIGYMPDLQQLENPVDKYASQILSADGKVIGTWSYSKANRVFVGYEDLPPHLIQALVATEDERFHEHSGIDFRALFRVAVKRLIFQQKSAGGGSTITQQLVKQLYSSTASSLRERALQKPIEWVISLKIERYYTKEEIITMYLNHFDFLHNAVGIKTAARTYFGKEPRELTLVEAATLVGMCKNPSYFNPVRKVDICRDRRNVVLGQMRRLGYITPDEYQRACQEPLTLNFHRVDHKQGVGTYLRDNLRRMLMAQQPQSSQYAAWQRQQYYEDSLAWATNPLYGWCNKNKNREGRPYNIYTDGLKIHTTLDSRMQHYAELAVDSHVVKVLQPTFDKENSRNKNRPYYSGLPAKQAADNLQRAIRQSGRYVTMKADGHGHDEIMKTFNTPIEMTVYSPDGEIDTLMTPLDSIKYHKGFLRCGFMCMDTETGHVKAYVGGVDFTHFQYDMCMQGRRQVGSTIKPYLYALAMESGWSPCDLAPNVQQTYNIPGDKTWTPRNGSRSRYGEMVTLKWGLAQSNNWISAYLMSQLSPDALVRLIHEFGIVNQDIHPSISLCLGPCDISVAEMVSAYTAFPMKGVRRSPLLVSHIEDSDGNVIAQFESQVREVISEEAAYKMIILMQGVMNGGTGSRMRARYGITADMGGKTGTTNDNSDGWFVGYTPRLSFGAWVGGEERDIHFASMANGQGANSALPIAAQFIKRVYADTELGYSPDDKFDIPPGFDPCASVYGDDEAEGDILEGTEAVGLDDLAN